METSEHKLLVLRARETKPGIYRTPVRVSRLPDEEGKKAFTSEMLAGLLKINFSQFKYKRGEIGPTDSMCWKHRCRAFEKLHRCQGVEGHNVRASLSGTDLL